MFDLITPFPKGGKVGAYGGAGVGKTVIIQELIRNIGAVHQRVSVFAAWASGPARATTCGTKWKIPAFWAAPCWCSAR